ncbi:MAG: hypothetical protein IPO93_03420 [Actinobacteria bacterium]|nr:hypothetical protein [Actinomycetota bacterium]
MTAEQVGHLAFTEGCELHELTPDAADLRRSSSELTGGLGMSGSLALLRAEWRKVLTTKML